MSVDEEENRLNYNESKKLAKSKDPAVRAKLASRKDVSPELLYFLAEDSDPEVRRNVANNISAPDQTHLILANDETEDVRSQLAVKIAKSYGPPIIPTSRKSQKMTLEALVQLAGDQITIVRRELADAIKSVPGAPADVIFSLANDTEIEVCGPVLEHSPVLTDADLIKIIASPSAAGALNFVSRRGTINELVSEAIIASDDIGAIGELLGNSNAQIQEALLDGLINRAEPIELWHAPLVSRPHLPKTAAARLAHFVAENLLEELQQRDDVDEATIADVKRIVEERFGDAKMTLEDEASMPKVAHDYLELQTPIEMVQRIFENRKLDRDMVARALDAGDYSFVLAALVVNSDVDDVVAKKIFSDKSAKGIVALCRLSAIPLDMLIKVQQRMGKIPPKDVLLPDAGDYPLTEQEAEWQIEFYSKIASKPA